MGSLERQLPWREDSALPVVRLPPARLLSLLLGLPAPEELLGEVRSGPGWGLPCPPIWRVTNWLPLWETLSILSLPPPPRACFPALCNVWVHPRLSLQLSVWHVRKLCKYLFSFNWINFFLFGFTETLLLLRFLYWRPTETTLVCVVQASHPSGLSGRTWALERTLRSCGAQA